MKGSSVLQLEQARSSWRLLFVVDVVDVVDVSEVSRQTIWESLFLASLFF